MVYDAGKIWFNHLQRHLESGSSALSGLTRGFLYSPSFLE
jgi:hypothetical protein